jgi:hypothetical protein
MRESLQKRENGTQKLKKWKSMENVCIASSNIVPYLKFRVFFCKFSSYESMLVFLIAVEDKGEGDRATKSTAVEDDILHLEPISLNEV